MTKSEKNQVIEELKNKFSSNSFFYIADSTSMTVEQVNKLRKLCFTKGIELRVAKNSLIEKALEATGKSSPELIASLKGQSSIMFSEQSNLPAKTIKQFRGDKGELPKLKLAYIESELYVGNDQLDSLATLKSKNELIADVIALLQSPAKNVISGLKGSAGGKLAGLIKTLQNR